MTPRCIRLLVAILLFSVVGFFSFPMVFPVYMERAVVKEDKVKHKPIRRNHVVDDWATDDSLTKEEPADAEEVSTDKGDEGPARVAKYDEDSFHEDNVEIRKGQEKVSAARQHIHVSGALAKLRNLETSFEKDEAKNFTNDDFPAESWSNSSAIHQSLQERILAEIGNAGEDELLKFMSKPANRLDLARLTLIRKCGSDAVDAVAAMPKGKEFLAALTRDLNWMTNLLYTGPTQQMGKALENMALIYAKVPEGELNHPVVRRIATTASQEFARERWNSEDLLPRFDYYYSSYKDGLLNKKFETLDYWETRFVTGCKQPQRMAGNWGEPRNLRWLRDNVRLPEERYFGSEGQLAYRLRNVAGDSVFSEEYLAPILSYTNFTTAYAYRCIGGVCGALSHYATFSALAAGLPASTCGEPGHCSYAMRVNGEWRAGNAIYWQRNLHKTFWGEGAWDFLILTQNLYSDRFKTSVSDQFMAMGDFLSSQRMNRSALDTYELAVRHQPLNWPAMKRYAAYLRKVASDDLARWESLHDAVMDGMGKEHHHAAATMLSKYIYPGLAPLVENNQTLNRKFSGLFKHFKNWGSNRWDIAPVLNAQIATCRSDAERKVYLREVLRVLMAHKEYAGPVLTWGLAYVAAVPESNAKLKDEFTSMLMSAMARKGGSRKEMDETWATLGEAICMAENNAEPRTFQAIGKLAYMKCKSKFAKKGVKVSGFPGKVVSSTGYIKTATTLGDGQVRDGCLHWAVLQPFGGSIPGKFEGKAGLTVGMENSAEISGVVCVAAEKIEKKDRPFYIEVSSDNQNWYRVGENGVIDGRFIRFDLRKAKRKAKFVRMLREGDKYEPGISGFYVYGKEV